MYKLLSLMLAVLLLVSTSLVSAQDDDDNVIRVPPSINGFDELCRASVDYEFEGVAGDVVSFDLVCTATPFNSNVKSCLLTLAGPDARRFFIVGDFSVNRSYLTDVTLPETGSYTLGVSYSATDEGPGYCHNAGYELRWSFADTGSLPGDDLFFAGDYAGAIAAYSSLIAQDASNATAYFNRGFAHFHNQEIDAALADLNQAALLEPDNIDTLFFRGVIYIILGEGELALADHQRVDGLDPAGNKFWVGLSYLSLGDPAQAIPWLEADRQASLQEGVNPLFETFWLSIAHLMNFSINGDAASSQTASTLLDELQQHINATPIQNLPQEEQVRYMRVQPLLLLVQSSPEQARQSYLSGMFSLSSLPHDRTLDRAYIYLLAEVMSDMGIPDYVETRDWFDQQIFGGVIPAASGGSNLVVNPGAEMPLVNGSMPGWTTVAGNWIPDVYVSPAEGSYHFFAGTNDYAELTQDVDVSSYAPTIDAGTQFFNFSAQASAYIGFSATDAAQIIVEYLDESRTTVLDSYDSTQLILDNNWFAITDRRLAPVGTRWIRIRLISIRNGGFDNDGYFDAISLTAESAE